MRTPRRWRIIGIIGLVAMAPSAAAVAAPFDLSRSRVPPEAIVAGGPPRDGIPALTDPDVVSADAASYLRPEDEVIGVAIGGQARAYPIRILNWHEIVNDRLGGRAIAVTYCPLCGSGMVFDAERSGERLEFGVSGLLYNSDVLMYDRRTESLWSRLRMEAVTGPRAGERLAWLPAERTSWQAWRRRYPMTDVLSLRTGHHRDYGRDPYAGYEATERTMFPVSHRDVRVPAKAWVVGVVVNGAAAAYPLDRLAPGEVVEDVIGGERLRIERDGETASAVRVTDAAGRPVPSVQAYWFAWVAFYPATALHGDERRW